MNYSDYIVYADESGDHGLMSIDPQSPVFVLAFCIFEKTEYIEQVVPAVQKFKFDLCGHDLIVLHGHDIRKAQGKFSFMKTPEAREHFMQTINGLMTDVPFTLVASVIHKDRFKRRYANRFDPYKIALMSCMSGTYEFLKSKNQHDKKTMICFECRGLKEDKDLELEFRRIVQDADVQNFPFDIHFATKGANLTGMQIADLVAYPIGRNAIKPDQPNRAYQIIEPKFFRSDDGKLEGCGIKHVP